MRSTGFIDGQNRWSGGSRRLVQLGDLFGRGPKGLEVMDLFMRLQPEAEKAGGQVVCLIGNNEAAALRSGAGDLTWRVRWIYFGGIDAIYREWAARQGKYAAAGDLPYPEDFWLLFAPGGYYGRWLRTLKLAHWAADYVVVHAGWTSACPSTVEAANAAFAALPAAPEAFAAAWRPGGALAWTNDLLFIRNQPAAGVIAASARIGSRGFIVGHEITPGIQSGIGGRQIRIDVGLYQHGNWAALGLDTVGNPWALLPNHAPLPVADVGLYPVPDAAAAEVGSAAAPPKPPGYGPGQLINLYTAPDGTWSQFLQVKSVDRFKNAPAYAGNVITNSGAGWTTRKAVFPAPAVDRFGVPQDNDAVPPIVLDQTADGLDAGHQ